MNNTHSEMTLAGTKKELASHYDEFKLKILINQVQTGLFPDTMNFSPSPDSQYLLTNFTQISLFLIFLRAY